MGDDLGRVRVGGEGVHEGGRPAGGHQDVDIADGLLHPAQGSRVRAPDAAADVRQFGDELLGDLHGRADEDPALAGLLQHRDAVQDVVLGALAEALQVAQPLLPDGVDQLVDRGDAQFLVQQHGLAGAEARNPDQLAHPGRYGRPGLVDKGHAAGAQVLEDLVGDRSADVGDLAQALGIEGRDVLRVAPDGAGGLLVGARLEGLPASDRDEVGVLLEERLDLVVGSGHVSRVPPRAPGGHAGRPRVASLETWAASS